MLQNVKDLTRRLEDANIHIVTVEAVSDTAKPERHIESLLVMKICVYAILYTYTPHKKGPHLFILGNDNLTADIPFGIKKPTKY